MSPHLASWWRLKATCNFGDKDDASLNIFEAFPAFIKMFHNSAADCVAFDFANLDFSTKSALETALAIAWNGVTGIGATTKAPGLVPAKTAMSPCRVMSSTKLEQILSQPLYKEIGNDSEMPKGGSTSAASSEPSQMLPMEGEERYPAFERKEPVSSSTSSLSLGDRGPGLATAGLRLGSSESRDRSP